MFDHGESAGGLCALHSAPHARVWPRDTSQPDWQHGDSDAEAGTEPRGACQVGVWAPVGAPMPSISPFLPASSWNPDKPASTLVIITMEYQREAAPGFDLLNVFIPPDFIVCTFDPGEGETWPLKMRR